MFKDPKIKPVNKASVVFLCFFRTQDSIWEKIINPNIEPINKRKFSEAMTEGTVLLSCWMTLTQIEEFNTQSSGKVFFKEFQH